MAQFNTKITSNRQNFTADYFELRAQKGQDGAPVLPSTNANLSLKGPSDSELVTYNRSNGTIRYTGGILYGTGSPPDPSSLVDGTLYFRYT